jgi:hypothetical protein
MGALSLVLGERAIFLYLLAVINVEAIFKVPENNPVRVTMYELMPARINLHQKLENYRCRQKQEF